MLDLVMPDMDGASCMSELRAIDSSLKIIVCSGFDRESSTSSLAQDDKVLFLDKPFESSELLATLDALYSAR
jgi:DNA-binding response OmpR family regulator